jgi:UDP:flavonoid glycosyltransferase YjiC (YdhE family)
VTPTRIAVFCMPEPGHFQLLRPLVAGLARRGAEVGVFTARAFEAEVRSAGANFTDLFAGHPLESADDASLPFPCRYVSYAGHCARQLAGELERERPALIVYETFALIGRVVAGLLGVPWVNLSPGHDLDPARYVRGLETDPRVSISPACDRAVATLRGGLGLPDASPFSFVTSLSPFLNICCEPPAFLPEGRRQVFEPLAFFGSLPSPGEPEPGPSHPGASFSGDAGRFKVYASFGTIVWRYYRQEAFAALQALSRYLADRPDAEGLISLGHAELKPGQRRRLEGRNVRVEPYVDQVAVLREADLFVTHNGINSTHQAIFSMVPMLSYPFFWDQPDLAAMCQDRGLAVPISRSIRGRVTESLVSSAIEASSREPQTRRTRFQRARNEELEVVAGRGEVFDRVLALAREGL